MSMEELRRENEALREELKARQAMAEHLASERGLLRTLIDNMPDHIYVKDRSGRFVIANHAAAEGIGVASPAELVGKSDLEFYPLGCGQRFFTDEQQIMKSGQPLIDHIEENVNHAGVRRWFSTTKYPFYGADGQPAGIVGISRDVTLRVNAEEAVRLRNRAIELSGDATVIVGRGSPELPVLYVNPAFERITGFTLEEAQQSGIAGLLEDGEDPAATQALALAMAREEEGGAVLRSWRKDGTAFWNKVRLAIVRDRDGKATHFVYTMSDVSKALDAEQKLEQLASHDELTGLPNRRLLMDRLGQAIAIAQRSNCLLAVSFIDLDRLKFVNDTHGHEAGDRMLRAVAERMAGCVRQSDTVARLGGDEFVLVSLHQVPPAVPGERTHVAELLAKVQEVLAQPLMLGDAPFSVTCSIGVSMYPDDGQDAETMLKHADEAMYTAKKSGRNQVAFYTPPPEGATASADPPAPGC
ncbi:PAS domain S-box-containing protein/diguanylate cyclase (GGDEF) domain-containing protein [Pseudoduganella namucuonensis]|uniref:PAS domain S-box-containing protein/diguanylate cyclase (GGDEF) domain-containing protein n=2 Tax=Pseudoduganella namucuonensis TaxID=1035707 RepID=A0A1I7FJE3_9BURK|nr:PAS domain S-box-containing protein/diguanylate cyclase (GGDEF) domain-containing protein [Pseudoduganella namucuonensis]